MTMRATVICAPAGSSIGPETSVVSSASVPAGNFAGNTAICPAGTVATGGGVDLNNVLTMDVSESAPAFGATFLSSEPDGAAGAADRWIGQARNHTGAALSMKIAVLCANQTSLSAETSVIGSASAPAHSFAVPAVMCPSGSEAVGGGVDLENVLTMAVTSTAPRFNNAGGRLYVQPDGAGAGGVGWQVSGENETASPKTVKVAVLCIAAPPPPPPPSAKPIVRLSGGDRILTAIAVSMNGFPTAGSAGAVVLARGFDVFADALAGTPLAVAKHAPLLLTSSDSLDSRTLAEIQRVLPSGGTVYVLGGLSALSSSIDASLSSAGFVVVRLAGADRFGTAVQIAAALGNPTKILEATGLNFPDALSAGAAAAKVGGAVLLTSDTTQAGATAGYLAAHPGDVRFAIGGEAAAADPGATPIVGSDRFQTSARVAANFFSAPTVIAAALGTNFPDALSGGAFIGAKGGPLVLVLPSAPLPPDIQAYLSANHTTIASGFLYGGTGVVGEDVRTALSTVITTG
jgi:putative cell wall-binding protein